MSLNDNENQRFLCNAALTSRAKPPLATHCADRALLALAAAGSERALTHLLLRAQARLHAGQALLDAVQQHDAPRTALLLRLAPPSPVRRRRCGRSAEAQPPASAESAVARAAARHATRSQRLSACAARRHRRAARRAASAVARCAGRCVPNASRRVSVLLSDQCALCEQQRLEWVPTHSSGTPWCCCCSRKAQ